MAGTIKDIPVVTGSVSEFRVMVDRKSAPAESSTGMAEASLFKGDKGDKGDVGPKGEIGGQPLWSTDTITVPTTNATYWAQDDGDYNLPLISGTQTINVSIDDIDPTGDYDRIELVYNKESDSWTKKSIEKKKLRTEEGLGLPYNVGQTNANGSLSQIVGYQLTPGLKVANDHYIRKVFYNADSAGTLTIAVGTVVANKFVERDTIALTVAGSGVNEITVPGDFLIKKDEYPAIKSIVSCGIRYLSVGSPNGGRWGSDGYDGEFYTGDDVNILSYGFQLQQILYPEVVPYNEFKETESKANDSAIKLEGLRVDEVLGPLTSQGNTAASADLPQQLGWQWTPTFYATEDRYIREISLYASGVGTAQFAVGYIDQWDKFIVREEISFPTTGVEIVTYSVPFNFLMKQGDYFVTKQPMSSGISYRPGAPGSGGRWTTDGLNGTIIRADTSNTIAYAYKYQTVEVPTVASYSGLAQVDGRVSALENAKPVIIPTITKPSTGEKFIPYLDASNQLQFALATISHVLNFGNSLLWHMIISTWWGEWGMAASEAEKDYAHVMLAALKAKTGNNSMTQLSQNIADWEANHATYNLSNFDSFFTTIPQLVTIRLGENVGDFTGFDTSLGNLIDYIRLKAPLAQIILGGQFWYNGTKEDMIINTAAAKNVTYVQLYDLDTPANRSFIGAQVKGNDGNWHTVNDSGVASHPGDSGMASIGNRLANAVQIN